MEYDMSWNFMHKVWKNLRDSKDSLLLTFYSIWQWGLSVWQNLQLIEHFTGQKCFLTFSAGQMSDVPPISRLAHIQTDSLSLQHTRAIAWVKSCPGLLAQSIAHCVHVDFTEFYVYCSILYQISLICEERLHEAPIYLHIMSWWAIGWLERHYNSAQPIALVFWGL